LNRTDESGIYIQGPMRTPSIDSISGFGFRTAATPTISAKPSEIEREVMNLFEQFRNPLVRYALSFGIPVHDAEEITQEVFLSLFQHLQSLGSRKNIRGWIFRVAHNIALKQRYANQKSRNTSHSIGQSRNGSLTRHRILRNKRHPPKGDVACQPLSMLFRKRIRVASGCVQRASGTGK
jgi:hypothetical protein